MNADSEVECFLRGFDLLGKQDTILDIRANSPCKVPFPTPATYEAAVRCYLEICAPVSRHFIAMLSQFSPADDVRTRLITLGQDKDTFHQEVVMKCLTPPQLLETPSPKRPFSGVPFSAVIEGVKRL